MSSHNEAMLNLDTHMLIYAVSDSLVPWERSLLEDSRWSISAIVWWEIAKLAQLERININWDSNSIKRLIRRLHVWPIDIEIAITSTQLDFQSDPVDELIAATSVVHKIPLLTRDERILSSKIVPFAM